MQLKHLTLAALGSYAFAQSDGENPVGDLNTTLSGNADLSNLTTFLSASPELLQTLSSAQNITILAPNNEAFAALANSSAGQALASDAGLIAAILTYHVINGSIGSGMLNETSQFFPTLLSNETYSNVTGGQVVEAVVIGNETVFYSGLLQNATVVQADITFSNGILHVIDSVLTLPLSVLDTAAAANLSALRGAVNATDLIDVVNETPNVTIFAPDNEAFRSIGSALANLSTEDLTNILGYHVVNGTVAYSTLLENGSSVQASNGEDLSITIDNGTVFVNAARVITPNILVANGVVHVIDNVLNPSNTTVASAGATTGAPGYAATPASEVPFTSGLPEASTTINPTTEGAGPAQTTVSSTAIAPKVTGAIGYGALLGAGAAMYLGV